MEVAEILGISQPVVSLYEKDELAFRWDQVAALARLFRVSSDVLLGLATESTSRRGPRDTRLARMLRDAEALPRRELDALVRTINAFLSANASSPT